jgi:hypothetical protein
LSGEALRQIRDHYAVLNAGYESLEVELLIKANVEITLTPDQAHETLVSLLAAGGPAGV